MTDAWHAIVIPISLVFPQSQLMSLERAQFQGKSKLSTSGDLQGNNGSMRPHLIGPQMVVAEPASSRGNVESEYLILWRVHCCVVYDEFGLKDTSGREDAATGGEVLALTALSPGRRRKKNVMQGCQHTRHLDVDTNTSDWYPIWWFLWIYY